MYPIGSQTQTDRHSTRARHRPARGTKRCTCIDRASRECVLHAIQYMSAIRRVLAHGSLRFSSIRIRGSTCSRLNALSTHRVCCEGKRYFTRLGKSGMLLPVWHLPVLDYLPTISYTAQSGLRRVRAIERGDIIFGVSQSGRTLSLSTSWIAISSTIPIDFIALTGNPESALARRADVALTCAVPDDAELLGILPTASVLAAHHVFNSILRH